VVRLTKDGASRFFFYNSAGSVYRGIVVSYVVTLGGGGM
jgi:hypothetical protein